MQLSEDGEKEVWYSSSDFLFLALVVLKAADRPTEMLLITILTQAKLVQAVGLLVSKVMLDVRC